MEVEQATDTQLDLPPEYCHYQDEGCGLADSCLACPFPKCVYDEPRGRQRLLKSRRDREIVRLFQRGGQEVTELAQVFGISQRTVQRALKNYRLRQEELLEARKDRDEQRI